MNEETTATEENADSSHDSDSHDSGEHESEEHAGNAEKAHPTSRQRLMSPAAKKMLSSLMVMAGAALIVVGSLLPWLSDDMETTVVGNLEGGYGLLALIFGLALFASILRKKGACTHSYLAFGAFWAVIAFVLGPNRDEAVGVWLTLAGAILILVVIEYQDIKEMLQKAKSSMSEKAEHQEASHNAEDAAEKPTEDTAAVNKRAANAGLAFLAGLGALLSTFLWDWVNLGRGIARNISQNLQDLVGGERIQDWLGRGWRQGSEGPAGLEWGGGSGIRDWLGDIGGAGLMDWLGTADGSQLSDLLRALRIGGDQQLSGFDEPLRMVLIIFGFSILVLVGALVSLQERSFSRPMPGLLKAIRTSWVLAGIAICTVSGGILLGNVFWNDLAGGGLREGPFIAFLSGILLLCASRSEWAEPECEVSLENSET